jgi:hypothetical protein
LERRLVDQPEVGTLYLSAGFTAWQL